VGTEPFRGSFPAGGASRVRVLTPPAEVSVHPHERLETARAFPRSTDGYRTRRQNAHQITMELNTERHVGRRNHESASLVASRTDCPFWAGRARPEPHRMTLQPAVNWSAEPAICAPRATSAYVPILCMLTPSARRWGATFCAPTTNQIGQFGARTSRPRGRLSLRRGSRPEATSHLTACRDDPKAVPAKMAG
jgi:hypothetical protein